MQKYLKLAKPFVITYPSLTHILAMIQDIPTAKEWFFNHFIQIQISNETAFPALNVNFCFGDVINSFMQCPFLRTEKISKQFLDDFGISLSAIIMENINSGKYLCIPADWYFLPCSECFHKKHMAHEILISGYDSETHEIEISDFFKNGHYSTGKCNICDLNSAFTSAFMLKPCFLENYIISFEIKEIYFDFNAEIAIGLLEDYYYARNSHFRFQIITKYFDFLSKDIFVFGIKTYDILIKYIDKAINGEFHYLDINSLHMIEQQKMILNELFDYMYRNGYMPNDDCFNFDFKYVLEHIGIIKKLAMKYNIKSSINVLNSIKEHILNVQKEEESVLKYIIDNVTCYPRLKRKQDQTNGNNSILYIGKDELTGGNWINKYGKCCYDIFFEAKRDNDIKVVYYNFVPKIWDKNSSLPIALESTQLPMNRIAMCKFFKKNAYIEVLITNNRFYEMCIYFLDACSIERKFEILMLDGDTDEEIMRTSIKVHAEGKYMRWKISGHIRIEFENSVNDLGVISGIFFNEYDNTEN